MTYCEQPPPRALAPWVQCTWRRSGDGGPPVRVVPDGCIDIVWTEGAGTHVVGPNTRAFLVALPARTRVAGVRLHPGAAPSLLGVDAAALRDGRVAIEAVWGDRGLRLAERLDACDDRATEIVAALDARHARVARLVPALDDRDARAAGLVPALDDRDARAAGLVPALDAHDARAARLVPALDERDAHARVLLSSLAARAGSAAAPDPLVRTAVARLVDPQLGVVTLARDLGVSERQLRRRFESAVGYGPKRLARVLRLERALSAARAGEDLGRVAFDAGYADQAHFANDCRDLAGVAPSALLAA